MLIRANTDGTYSANWTPGAVGLYTIHVTIDGIEIGKRMALNFITIRDLWVFHFVFLGEGGLECHVWAFQYVTILQTEYKRNWNIKKKKKPLTFHVFISFVTVTVFCLVFSDAGLEVEVKDPPKGMIPPGTQMVKPKTEPQPSKVSFSDEKLRNTDFKVSLDCPWTGNWRLKVQKSIVECVLDSRGTDTFRRFGIILAILSWYQMVNCSEGGLAELSWIVDDLWLWHFYFVVVCIFLLSSLIRQVATRNGHPCINAFLWCPTCSFYFLGLNNFFLVVVQMTGYMLVCHLLAVLRRAVELCQHFFLLILSISLLRRYCSWIHFFYPIICYRRLVWFSGVLKFSVKKFFNWLHSVIDCNDGNTLHS